MGSLPERKASKKEIEYATKRLDGVIARITNAMKSTIQKIQTTLMKPEVKKAGTEQIKKKAKSSIIEQLSRKRKKLQSVKSAEQFRRKTKSRIRNSKALAVFILKMTGAFALGSKKISSIL